MPPPLEGVRGNLFFQSICFCAPQKELLAVGLKFSQSAGALQVVTGKGTDCRGPRQVAKASKRKIFKKGPAQSTKN